MKNNGALTSGQLGASASVSPDTIRHYEKLGLLVKPVRTEGGYRLYPAEALQSVRTVRSALKAGFSLAELAEIFKERDAGGAPVGALQSWLATRYLRWTDRLQS
jgi:DNA-binding transcriptional MerR regulator